MNNIKNFGLWYFFLAFILMMSLLSSLNYYIHCHFLSEGDLYLSSTYSVWDFLSFIFFFLTLCLGACVVFCFSSFNYFPVLFCSIVSSMCCYTTSSALYFWMYYEISILSLLLIMVMDSPYSERYLAMWYFMGYMIFFSLPMIVSMFYISTLVGDSKILFYDYKSPGATVSMYIMAISFVTKIPLFPFHSWLPIVHAEAPKAASICLSGYIMKLGVVGLYRFCIDFLPVTVFSTYYTWLMLTFSAIFFFMALQELDGKRWVAFLSLSHMTVVGAGCHLCDLLGLDFPLLYCLGHGLTAASSFLMLWVFSSLSGSRNWCVLKSGCFSPSSVLFFCVSCLFSLASLPPTMTFFCEVFILSSSLHSSLFILISLCMYLFLSALMPIFAVVCLLSVGVTRVMSSCPIWHFFSSLLFLILWIYFFCFMMS